MSRVIVAGAAGFIGGCVAETLLAGGHKVTCLVRVPSRAERLEKLGAAVVAGDVTRPETLERPLAESDALVNCAGVLRSRDVSRYYSVNRDAVENIAKIARAVGAKVVHISSLAAYGPSSPGRPRRLTDLPAPVSEYGRSKLEGALALASSGARYSLIVPSAVYGPRDKDMFFFFKAVSAGWGVSTKPERYLNMSFSEDVARACAAVATTDASDGESYYVADPAERSWRNVCEVIASAAGRKIRTLSLPDFLIRASAAVSEKASAALGKDAVFNRDKAREMLEPAWTCADAHAAEERLGFKFADFAAGAAKTYNWYKENGLL